MYGFCRDEGRISSILIFSIWRLREVACRAFDALAEKRRTNSCRSEICAFALAFGGFDALPRLHRGEHEVVVVARVDLQLLVVEVGDVRAHLVQEVPVVADDDHRRVVVVERALEPADRVDVEVVGRLVEQQHVGPREQRLREQHAQLQARRDLAHRQVVLRLVDARVDQDRAGARLGRVAVVLRDLAFELGRPHVVLVGGLRVRRRCGRAPASRATSRRGPASRRRARARPRTRTGSGSACRGACRPAAPRRRRSAPARRPGSSSASTCRSRSRRSARSGCRRRT